MKKYLLAFVIFYSRTLFAQTEKLEDVPIQLNASGILNNVYPFDVPFTISGAAPENCYAIKFAYRVQPKDSNKPSEGYKHWISLPDKQPNGEYVPSGEWKRISDEKKFALYCIGLHPNIKYDFEFTILQNPALDETKKNALKKTLITIIQKFYEKFIQTGVAAKAESDQLDVDLNTSIKTALVEAGSGKTLKLRSAPATDYAVSVTGNLASQYRLITSKAVDDYNTNAPIAAQSAIITRLFNDPGLLAEVTDIVNNKTKINESSKELLDITFNPSSESFKYYTLRDGIKLLKVLFQFPAKFTDLTEGKGKIVNADVEKTDKIDLEGLQFLQRLISRLSDGIIVEVSGKTPTKLFTRLAAFNRPFDALLPEVLKKTKAKAAANVLIETFPDLTLDIVTAESLNSTVVSVADVSTEKTPYISANGGLGYSTAFKSAVSYFGANFYFSPVNKKAPLSTFRGTNLLRKMICVNVALASYFGTRQPNTTSVLGGTSTDLMLGLGLRVNRVIELTGSWLPYHLNTNPVTTDKSLKCDFIFGVAVDVNILGAFSSVAKGLKLIP